VYFLAVLQLIYLCDVETVFPHPSPIYLESLFRLLLRDMRENNKNERCRKKSNGRAFLNARIPLWAFVWKWSSVALTLSSAFSQAFFSTYRPWKVSMSEYFERNIVGLEWYSRSNALNRSVLYHLKARHGGVTNRRNKTLDESQYDRKHKLLTARASQKWRVQARFSAFHLPFSEFLFSLAQISIMATQLQARSSLRSSLHS